MHCNECSYLLKASFYEVIVCSVTTHRSLLSLSLSPSLSPSLSLSLSLSSLSLFSLSLSVTNCRFCSWVCTSSKRTGGRFAAANQDGWATAGLQGLFMLTQLYIPNVECCHFYRSKTLRTSTRKKSLPLTKTLRYSYECIVALGIWMCLCDTGAVCSNKAAYDEWGGGEDEETARGSHHH